MLLIFIYTYWHTQYCSCTILVCCCKLEVRTGREDTPTVHARNQMAPLGVVHTQYCLYNFVVAHCCYSAGRAGILVSHLLRMVVFWYEYEKNRITATQFMSRRVALPSHLHDGDTCTPRSAVKILTPLRASAPSNRASDTM
jgi:hypothetical protein